MPASMVDSLRDRATKHTARHHWKGTEIRRGTDWARQLDSNWAIKTDAEIPDEQPFSSYFTVNNWLQHHKSAGKVCVGVSKKAATANKPSQKNQEQGHAARRGTLIKAAYEGCEVRVRVLVKGQRTCSNKAKKVRGKIKINTAANFLIFLFLYFLLGL